MRVGSSAKVLTGSQLASHRRASLRSHVTSRHVGLTATAPASAACASLLSRTVDIGPAHFALGEWAWAPTWAAKAKWTGRVLAVRCTRTHASAPAIDSPIHQRNSTHRHRRGPGLRTLSRSIAGSLPRSLSLRASFLEKVTSCHGELPRGVAAPLLLCCAWPRPSGRRSLDAAGAEVLPTPKLVLLRLRLGVLFVCTIPTCLLACSLPPARPA